MKVALGAIAIGLSVFLSGCSTEGGQGAQTPTPSNKTFSVFLDLDDNKSLGWGVVNILQNEAGTRALLYSCGNERYSELLEWYPVTTPGNSNYLVMGTMEDIVYSKDDIKLLGSKQEVLALPVSVSANADGGPSCALEFVFENVPFDDLPFMVDLSEFKLDPVWFNASEAESGEVHIPLEKLDFDFLF